MKRLWLLIILIIMLSGCVGSFLGAVGGDIADHSSQKEARPEPTAK